MGPRPSCARAGARARLQKGSVINVVRKAITPTAGAAAAAPCGSRPQFFEPDGEADPGERRPAVAPCGAAAPCGAPPGSGDSAARQERLAGELQGLSDLALVALLRPVLSRRPAVRAALLAEDLCGGGGWRCGLAPPAATWGPGARSVGRWLSAHASGDQAGEWAGARAAARARALARSRARRARGPRARKQSARMRESVRAGWVAGACAWERAHGRAEGRARCGGHHRMRSSAGCDRATLRDPRAARTGARPRGPPRIHRSARCRPSQRGPLSLA